MTRRRILIVLAALAVGAIWLSQLSAGRLVPSIAMAIERGLGRRVEIQGEATFLPWRLGFSLANVVIHDDPRFGLEPLAYVTDLQASVRLTALLRGRLEFDRLRLVDPSVNLAQGANGWNFPALLDQALTTATSDGIAPPEVEVTGGRLNIRFGENKSLYYLWDANLTIQPGRAGELSIYFDGVPARTDRGTKGFGRLSARGTVGLTGERKLNLQAALERSAASELLMLFQDRGSSVTGFFSGTAKLQGPLDAIAIDGRLQLQEFVRWTWLFGAGRGPAVEWGGVLNWDGQTVHLKTKPDDLAVGVALDGERLLGAAQWSSRIAVRDTPAEVLEQLAREFGFVLPGGTELAGKLNGEVLYNTKDGLGGKINFSGGTLALAGKAQADVEPTALTFAGRRATLAPVVIRQGTDILRVEAGYEWATSSPGQTSPGLSWAFSGPELDLSKAREWGMALPGRIQSGKWRGNLRYEASTGGWRGEGDLADAALDVEGLAAKVHLDSARVRLLGAEFSLSRMKGHVDDAAFTGDFQYDPAASEQSRLQLQLDELALGAVPAWFAPALDRPASLLSRTLGLAGDPSPDWVAGRRLNAQVQIKTIRLGEQSKVGPVTARLGWAKGVLQVTNLGGPGRMRGEGQLNLAGDSSLPSHFEFENIPWQGGLADLKLDADVMRTTPRGTFQANAHDIELVDGERWMQAHMEGQFEARSTGPKVTFEKIEIRHKAGNLVETSLGTGQSISPTTWEWNLDDQTEGKTAKKRKIFGPVFEGNWK